MVRYPSPPSQSWRTFLTNHADCLASIDFFVVPTATFHLLFGFIVLHHERRQIVHFGVTANPTMAWVAQQIREAFPWGTAPRYLIRDRDGAYGQSFRSTVTAMGVEEVVTAPRSPWQNPYVERLIGSVRRECLDHSIILNDIEAAFAAHSWLIPRLLSRFKDPLVARQGHTGWTTRSAGRVWNGRFLAQGRRSSASSLRTPRGLTTAARTLHCLLPIEPDRRDPRAPRASRTGRAGSGGSRLHLPLVRRRGETWVLRGPINSSLWQRVRCRHPHALA